MSSTSEVGHAKNVANLEELISFCTAYGAAYNPSKNNLKLPQLQTLLTAARSGITNVTSSVVAYNNAVNARVSAFSGFRKLSTRVLSALSASSASQQTINDAKSVQAKVQGSKLTKADAGKRLVLAPDTPVTETPKTISTSRQSYDSLMEHLAKMISIVSTEPSYAPNEADLKVTGLNATLTGLHAANTAVISAYTAYSNARIARNNTLYSPLTGLCEIAKEVKMYVRSVFGTTSPQYKQISGLRFTKKKI